MQKQNFGIRSAKNVININKPSIIDASKKLNNMKISKKVSIKNKINIIKSKSFSHLSYHIIRYIFIFAVKNYFDLIKLMKTCKLFHKIIIDKDFKEIWIHILRNLNEKFNIENYKDKNTLFLKNLTFEIEKTKKIEKFETFIKQNKKLFSSNSNKMKIPEKILKSLDLKIDIEIKLNTKKINFICNKKNQIIFDNFTSFIVMTLKELNEIKLAKDYRIEVEIFIKSGFLDNKISFKYIFDSKIIDKNHIKTKLFNIYSQNNCLIYFFENDDKLLKGVFHISGTFLLETFNSKIKNILRKLNMNKVKKNLFLQNDNSINDFKYFFKNESEFELIINISNLKIILFNYLNTKAFPTIIENDFVVFSIDLKDKIDHQLGVNISDELGISEFIPNLVFINFVLKCQDYFLINDSGYQRIEKRKNELNYEFDFDNNNFERLLVENQEKNYILEILFAENGKEKFKFVQNIKLIFKNKNSLNK